MPVFVKGLGKTRVVEGVTRADELYAEVDELLGGGARSTFSLVSASRVLPSDSTPIQNGVFVTVHGGLLGGWWAGRINVTLNEAG